MNGWKIGLMAAGAALCGPALAADFGVMETAETIEPKMFKLSGYPLLVDRAGTDNEGAGALVLGYGLPSDIDVEGMVARYDDATYFGADMEWSPWRNDRWQVSFGGGAHSIDIERGGIANGVDTTAILTYTPVHRLDLSAAVDASFEDVDVDTEVSADSSRFSVDNQFETVYFVPGLEYQLTRTVDLLAEAGVGLNGESDDYVGAGASWYFGR